jgi:hypothetical protein
MHKINGLKSLKNDWRIDLAIGSDFVIWWSSD